MTRVAVAGAGIAGLTAAIALAEHGVAVDLFEAADTLSAIGAGVQLSPNATRILRSLGVLEALHPLAVRPEAVRIRSGRDGSDLATLPLGEAAERRYGAPFLLAHRGDLQAVLLDAARRRPQVTLTTGARLAAIETVPEGARLTFAGLGGTPPRIVTADGLLGADGLHSAARRHVAQSLDPLTFSRRTAWRALVPVDAAPAYARQAVSNLWLGSGAHLVHYPVRGGSLVNVVAIVGGAWSGGADDQWATAGDPDRLRRPFASWCEEARALIDAAPDWRVWPLFERAPLARWAKGPVALAGDAAHPMLPFLAQGAAQAIEDGAAIGSAMRGASSFATAALAYEAARAPRAGRVQAESRRQGVIYHLPRPASLARDAAFRVLGPARMLARYDWLYGAPR